MVRELLLFSDRAIVVSNSIAGKVQFNWHRSGYTNMRQRQQEVSVPCELSLISGVTYQLIHEQ